MKKSHTLLLLGALAIALSGCATATNLAAGIQGKVSGFLNQKAQENPDSPIWAGTAELNDQQYQFGVNTLNALSGQTSETVTPAPAAAPAAAPAPMTKTATAPAPAKVKPKAKAAAKSTTVPTSSVQSVAATSAKTKKGPVN